ncbi:MAG TPA: aldo/keto reductase [bacterium (Candidatus Stahlbacteria)]|nr:aldo/keto reductase [Candidatus Stahlbacteria bacterium]
MIYRNFKCLIKISQLGFGAMRLPLKDPLRPEEIDENLANEMIEYAVAGGINYFDTAWGYHRRQSEMFLGRALKPYREKILLATKLPIYLVEKKGDPERILNQQLKRLNTEWIDMYLLHGLNQDSWKMVKEFDVLDFLQRKKGEEFRFVGFSFHDEFNLFTEIIDAFPWDLCLIHLNYVDTHHQAGIRGLEYAYDKGVPVFIMEPLRGGKLARNLPPEIMSIIEKTGKSPVQFALQFLFNRPEITCVLSGMSTLKEVRVNIEFAAHDYRNYLTEKDLNLYQKVRELFLRRVPIPCTLCRYCLPCREGIPIPFLISLYNDAITYNSFDDSSREYNLFIRPDQKPDRCTDCGECEKKCPQGIEIRSVIKEIDQKLSR